MTAILKREMKNYIKQPLFWIGVIIVIIGVYQAIVPYLETHYLEKGEEIINDYPEEIHLGEVYEGYVPSTNEYRRESWNKTMKETLLSEFQLSGEEVQNVMNHIEDMDINDACAYLEEQYQYYGAFNVYEESAYHKGTREEINGYLDDVLENHTFSYYFARKFADFAGLHMGFFATILLSVLFWQDTRKYTYELLHTKPIKAESYVIGKVGGGFCVCLFTLGILNIFFWILCIIKTKNSGFEVRVWDFLSATIVYILPNMLMIVCVYTLIALLFKNPLPGVPFLILYILYSNMGSVNKEGVYGYYGRPLAIMVRFPGQFFDTAPPPLVLLNQSLLLGMSVLLLFVSIFLWKRRRM